MLAILEKPEVLRHALPLSVEAYEQLAALDLVAPNTELIRGVVFEKTSKAPLHSGLVQYLVELLRPHLPAGSSIRSEQPLRFDDSCPEPDIAIVFGEPRQFLRQHPTTALMVIEIAVSSEALDREKAGIYAQAGIAEYWIVFPELLTIECLTQPSLDGYAHHTLYTADQRVTSEVLPSFAVNLKDLLA